MHIFMTLANPMTHDPRVYNEAKTLIDAGHEVTVLGWDRDGVTSSIENIDRINVVRSYNSKLMNLLKKDVFRMPLWWRKGYKEAVKLHEKYHFDIVHSHDLSSLMIGVKLKKKFGMPLIYDAHEIYGYLIVDDVPGIFTKIAFSTEKKWVNYANHIITVNDPLKDYFESITDVPISIVMNCKKIQGSVYEATNNDKFTLLYLGTLDRIRYLIDLPGIVKYMPDVNLIIGGKGRPDVVKELMEKCDKVSNADFVGMLPMKDVLPMTKKADVILCLFDPININNKVGLPNKLFESMVYGRPIICTKGIYSGDFVEKVKCGLTAEYNKKSITESILKLKNDPKLCKKLGENGLKAANEKYNWDVQAKEILKIYEGIK